MAFQWYDVDVDSLSCQLGIPLGDELISITKGCFDLTTPVAATRTGKAVWRFVETREDYDKIWSVYDDPVAARKRLEERYPTWEKIKQYLDTSDHPERVPVEERVMGVFRVELPNNDVICRVIMFVKYRYKGKDSNGIGLATMVKRGTQWLKQSKQSQEDPQWKPYDRAFMMKGDEVILECRKRAGVEPYEDVLKPKTLPKVGVPQ